MQEADVTRGVHLRRELLRLVLRDTLRRTGVPSQWIGGEATPIVDEKGSLTIEVRLILETDEPRFTYYLAPFQAEFEKRLLDLEPRAWDWMARISWSLHAHRADHDADFALPAPEYWQHVLADRHLTARQQGRMDWEPDALARHFEDTHPGEEQEDFENTKPPQWEDEDVRA